jgi:hypothetical protein
VLKKAVTPLPIELVVAVFFPSTPVVESTRPDGPSLRLSFSICEILLFVFVSAVVRTQEVLDPCLITRSPISLDDGRLA